MFAFIHNLSLLSSHGLGLFSSSFLPKNSSSSSPIYHLQPRYSYNNNRKCTSSPSQLQCCSQSPKSTQTPSQSLNLGRVFASISNVNDTAEQHHWDLQHFPFDPVVKRFVSEDPQNPQRWMMWYVSQVATDYVQYANHKHNYITAIGKATSSDGIHWRRVDEKDQLPTNQPFNDRPDQVLLRPVLEPNLEDWWWFDTVGLALGDLQLFSSSKVRSEGNVYWLYYHGASVQALPNASEKAYLPHPLADIYSTLNSHVATQSLPRRPSIGLALSLDGIHWSRIEGQFASGAILQPDRDHSHYDHAGLANPQVIQIDDPMRSVHPLPSIVGTASAPTKFRMYYHTYCPEKHRWMVAYASSPDGITWHKINTITLNYVGKCSFAQKGISNRHVVLHPSSQKWVMFCECIDKHNVRSIGIAFSNDGVEWFLHDGPILSPSSSIVSTASDTDPHETYTQDRLDTLKDPVTYNNFPWDGLGVAGPHAFLMDDGSIRLYYTGIGLDQHGIPAYNGIGLAVSQDPDWTTPFQRFSHS